MPLYFQYCQKWWDEDLKRLPRFYIYISSEAGMAANVWMLQCLKYMQILSTSLAARLESHTQATHHCI
jgi:hypothetical protein